MKLLPFIDFDFSNLLLDFQYLFSIIHSQWYNIFIFFNLIIISLNFTNLIHYSANAAKQGLKQVGKMLTGLGVGGSIYTGGKEVYKDIKELKNKPKTEDGNTNNGSSSKNENNKNIKK